jgi:hypothetical protein
LGGVSSAAVTNAVADTNTNKAAPSHFVIWVRTTCIHYVSNELRVGGGGWRKDRYHATFRAKAVQAAERQARPMSAGCVARAAWKKSEAAAGTQGMEGTAIAE